MTKLELHSHWEAVYKTKGEREVSWFEERPAVSLELIRATGVDTDASIIDIGGGASRLVDVLLDEGFRHLTVLDLSENALTLARFRLGPKGAGVRWISANVTEWEPAQSYQVWHDRAAFHFLTAVEDQAAYAERVSRAVPPGGHVIIGTFALNGPERCSGLPVARHDFASIAQVLGASFELVESRDHAHQTPAGSTQRFQFSRFQRRSTKRM